MAHDELMDPSRNSIEVLEANPKTRTITMQCRTCVPPGTAAPAGGIAAGAGLAACTVRRRRVCCRFATASSQSGQGRGVHPPADGHRWMVIVELNLDSRGALAALGPRAADLPRLQDA